MSINRSCQAVDHRERAFTKEASDVVLGPTVPNHPIGVIRRDQGCLKSYTLVGTDTRERERGMRQLTAATTPQYFRGCAAIFLLGFDPEMMPSPLSSALRSNASHDEVSEPFGGLASQETVETGVWMLSVLFCSCVCFGNIGRRLAWGTSAGAKGRWAGVR